VPTAREWHDMVMVDAGTGSGSLAASDIEERAGDEGSLGAC
jgi:hypothetical protein